jgi:FKBP-type peptidyl-prolyl cis-trans isomerase SlyD
MAIVQKNDFIEIEFTGKSNGEIFDTTNVDEAKSMGMNTEIKPAIISIGQGMLLKGFDKELEGKEVGKKYSIHLISKNAFGPRDSTLLKTIPIRVFYEKKMNPVPGMVFQFDNNLAKILTVSGGRVTADFNNPLAGKDVDYDFKILRAVTDAKEKINSIQDFFFRQRFEFEIKDQKVIFKDHKIKPLIDLFSPKFKEISGLDVSVEEKKEKILEEKKTEKQEKDKHHVHEPNCNHEH